MSQTYWSRRAQALVPYVAGEQPRDRPFIKLNTNENPYPPSPRVAQAVAAALPALPLYPDADSRALCDALTAHHGLPQGWAFAGNGSDEVLAFAFLAFFADAPLVAPDLTYSFYPVYASQYSIDYRTVPLEDDFSIRPSTLCQRQSVVLANPNAPTSRLMPEEALLGLADHCLAAGKVLLVDEAYADFGSVSMIPHLSNYPNLLVVRTFSKSHALAGQRVGYALGHPDLMEALGRVKDGFNSYPLDCLSQAAAQAAIEDADYYAQTTRSICATRDAFCADLKGLGFNVPPSAANFVFVRHPDWAGAALQQALRDRGILVRRFNTPRIAHHLRISIGTDPQMREVIQAMKAILHRS